MHMIAQIIIMMMVANVACTRHVLVSTFFDFIYSCVCLNGLASNGSSNACMKAAYSSSADASHSTYMTNMHHQIQASKEPHINRDRCTEHTFGIKLDPVRC